MQHPDRPAATDGESAIAHLRQRVYAWMDADRVLPEEGAALLAALGRALACLTGENAATEPVGIAAFTGQVQALIDAGVLAPADGRPVIEAAGAISASLAHAGETDSERSSRGETPRQEQR